MGPRLDPDPAHLGDGRDEGPAERLAALGPGVDRGPGPQVRVEHLVRRLFYFYIKKTKFQKYMSNREIFKNWCLSPIQLTTGPKYKKNYI